MGSWGAYFILSSIEQSDTSSHIGRLLIKSIKHKIPLALTQNGTLVVVANDKRCLYLPGGFKVDDSLSQINNVYDLVHSDEMVFFDVFMKLDVDKMSFGDYVKNVVIKYLSEQNDIEIKHRLLNWLCNEIELIRNDSEAIDALSNSNIIPRVIGSSLKPSEVYTPEFFQSLPISLQETTEKISVFQHKHWNELLDLLGAKKAVTLQHLFDGVIFISQRKDITEAYKLISFVNCYLTEFENLANKNTVLHKRIIETQWIPCKLGKYVVSGIQNSNLQIGRAHV